MDNVTHLPPRAALRLVDAIPQSTQQTPTPEFALSKLASAIEFSAYAQSDLTSTLRRIASGQPTTSPDFIDDIATANLLQAALHALSLRGARNDELVIIDMIRFWLRTHGVPQ